MNYKSIVKTEFMERELDEILMSDPSVLLGVSEEARDALSRLHVHTVFDLANSRVFNNALRLCDRSIDSSMSRFNLVPSDVVNHAQLGGDLDTAYQKPLEVLDGIGPPTAEVLERALSVRSVRDLAQWPPFQAVRQLLVAEREERDHFDDPDIPNELVPKFNEFPTEKFFYSVYLIDDVKDDVQGLIDLTAPMNLGTLETDSKFLGVRTGYIVRYEQSWTAMGLALGNLLHSITLAPGESTRVAMVDWTRRQGVRTTEDISQLEALSNSLMQTRSISEVTSAVAREAQSGFSKMDANSTVSNNAYSSYGLQNPKETLMAMAGGAAIGGGAGAAAGGVAGVGIGAVAGLAIGSSGAGIGAVPGMLIGAAAGGAIGMGSGGLIGATAGGAAAGLATANFGARTENTSNTHVDVVTTTSSSGERNLLASMAQNVMDRTQQHSSSSRNKKASIVQEVRQEEKEQITTRVVTNYNHMHALTMNYFEVVQLYSSKVIARELTRCLYVPFVKIAWNDELVERYKPTLIQSALSWEVAAALARPANLSLSFNCTVNSFTTEEKQKAIDPVAPLQARLIEFNSRLNVGVSANVLSPVYLPSMIEIKKIETELGKADLFFQLRDGQKIPSASTSYGQQQTTTYIKFAFRMRKLVQSGAGSWLPGVPIFGGESVEDGPLLEYVRPLVNNTVSVRTAFGFDISIPVNLSANVLHLPAEVLYRPDDILALASRPVGIDVPFTQTQVTNVPSSVAYVSKRVNELQKIVVRTVIDLAAADSAAARTDLSKKVFNVTFTFVWAGVDYVLTLPFKFREDRTSMLPSNKIALECDLVEFDHHAVKQDVLDHLDFNSDYYTQRIYQSLGELEYANLVSQYKYENRPLLNQVDIKPVALSGNYLIFKAKTTNDKAVDQWKRDNGYDEVKIEVIPLGTGGVFGEAVLGRANSAEKLDMTRFWNWQDSPILITPPEIAPLQAGSRAMSADVRPGQLDASLVGNMTPAALPNPEGLPAILNTLASGNLFRDMSGIAQTAQLAQTALEQAMSGATETGQMSTENLQKGLEFTKEIAGKIIQMTGDYGTLLANTGFGALTSAAGFPMGGARTGGSGSSTSGSTPNLGNSNPTVAGALLNHGRKMDESDASGTFNAPREIPVETSEQTFDAPQLLSLGNEQAAYDNIVGARRPPVTRARATPVEVTLNFKHQSSGWLDGEFTLEFIGGEPAAIDIRTVNGLGTAQASLVTGLLYVIQLQGFRTRRPPPRDPSASIAHIPALGGNDPFDFDVGQHIPEENVMIQANFVVTIPKGRKKIILTAVAEEATKTITISASASASGTLQDSFELQISPAFLGSKAGQVSVGVAGERVRGTETSIELPIEYKYLTDNVWLEKNDTIL